MPNEVTIDTSSFAKFARDLKRAEPRLAKSLRTNMKAAGEIVAEDARQRAGFSSRIPQNIKVGVAGSRIRVYVSAKKAPEARPLEHGGREGSFRHPVFGNRENWVPQPARPFLRPALRAKSALVVIAAKKAVDDALREVHSHG
jgi:hypothetical protein